MPDVKSPMDRFADFINSGRHRTEPIPEDIRRDLGQWLKERERTRRATYSDPMLPPWLYRPDIANASIGWRMGPGEDYRLDFQEWYSGLPSEDRDSYQKLYPEPEDWVGFYTLVLPNVE